MLAAPFFRGTFNCLIIPTGFANPAYSNLLPALRAASPRIKKFVENGGNLLVFGAATDKPDAYDWLPFPVTYRHDCHPRRIECSSWFRYRNTSLTIMIPCALSAMVHFHHTKESVWELQNHQM